MLEQIPDLPEPIVGVRATGSVSQEDYERVLEPLLGAARRIGRPVRFLYHFPPAFEGFTAGGALRDMLVGMRYQRSFERCGVVSDKTWLRRGRRAAAAVWPCPLQLFRESEWSAAIAWLNAGAASRSIDHRLLEDRGVLVVEPHGKIDVEAFQALSSTLDPWLAAGHELRGLVVHARVFPGWETVGSFLRHVQFMRDHQTRIRRVAVCVDGRLAKLAPALVELVVPAEIQHFGYDELDRAIEWAGRTTLAKVS